MSKTSILIVALIIVVGGLVFFFNQREQSELPVLPSPPSQPAGLPVMDGERYSITHTNAGYAPTTLTVKVGDTVTFRNEGSQETWPASALHPTHTLYPTTGGCFGSTFDACRGLESGEVWQFTFEIPGTWKYHDHLNPAFSGTVVVE